MSPDTAPRIRVTHHFEASPERVFDAWLNPEQIAIWMLGPARAIQGTQDEIVRITVDARVGGGFSFVVRRQGEEIDHVGEYLELDRPRRLVFTWGAPRYSDKYSRVSLDLAAEGTGTLLTLTAEGVDPEYQARTEKGWATILGVIATTV